MLTITRRPGESILLELEDGRIITIRNQGKRPGATKIGIDCDREIKIYRAETADLAPSKRRSR